MNTHTVGLTPFHPPLDTTTLAIVINGVQRVCQILRHSKKVLQNLILVFLFSLSHSSTVYSLSMDGGSAGLGWGLGLRFVGLGLG